MILVLFVRYKAVSGFSKYKYYQADPDDALKKIICLK
jgi:hypothetical protein